MLSNEGIVNLKLLKDMALNTWKDNIVLSREREIQIPVDAFEFQAQIYEHFKVLLEYETGTFALKIWTGEKYEYIEKFTSNKIFYGFDSMMPKNIQHNFDVLDEILRNSK